jgi:3-oxoacyl-[acyl-carrier-protein] synthase II
MRMRPLAITGLGIVSPLGVGREAFFAGLAALGQGPKTWPPGIQAFDAAPYPGARAAEVRDFDGKTYLGDKGLRNMDRLTSLTVVAAKLAAQDARLRAEGKYIALAADRVGICASTAYGSLEAINELDRVAMLENPRFLNPARFPNTVINSAAGYASIWEYLQALNVTVSNGNPGALDAVLVADLHLGAGRADSLLVGGAEAMSEGIYLAFQSLGSLAEDDGPYRPGEPAGIDAAGTGPVGTGIVLGEGAAFVVMETDGVARARGATVWAEVVGYGTAFEPPASEALVVHASTLATAQAARAALAEAGMEPGEIDVVAASVGGYPSIDAAELAALGEVFGPDVCIAAPKALFGETLGATGAMGMAAGLAWLGGIPPARVVRGRSPKDVRSVLVMAMGFHGASSAVVIRAR